MFPAAGARSPLFALALTAGCVLIFIFGFLAWQSPSRIPSFPHGNSHVDLKINENSPSVIDDVIRVMFEPVKIAPTEPVFADENGVKTNLPDNPLYTKRMGKDILILDLETRPLESSESFEKGDYDWRKINHVSGGIFNHYAYAMVHGYDYKLVQAQNFKDRHATWIKPSALANLINDYKFIIFLDADASFRHMHLPIEWLLNHWEVGPNDALTMALDPWDKEAPQFNSDANNRTYTNTGFIITQNTANTMEILKAWHECPDDKRYKTCSQWKEPKFHEQSAFGEYVRYDYEQYIKELPCAEANGFPGVTVAHCEGKFIRHYWFDKSIVKRDFQDSVMQALTWSIQKLFSHNRSKVIFPQEKNVITVR